MEEQKAKTGRGRKIIVMILLLTTLTGSVIVVYRTGIWKSKGMLTATALAPEIRTRAVKPEKLVHEISTPGTVSYYEKAAVNSKIPGRVEKLQADLGQKVQKRQPLARMETFELRIKLRQTLANVNSARARRNLSRARYKASRRNVEKQFTSIERMQGEILSARAGFLNSRRSLLNKKEIYSLGGASESELKSTYSDYLSSMSRYYQTRKDYESGIVGFRDQDLISSGRNSSGDTAARKKALTDLNTEVEMNEYRVARAEFRSARLELKNIRMLLREAVIRSPLTGVVAARNIEMGEEIKQGEPLFTVVRMDRLLISTNVPEEEIRHVKPGMKVRFIVDALDKKEFRGRVHQVAPVIDIKTRTAEVKIDVSNEKKSLNPGMFTRCFITTREKEGALALPHDILLNRRKDNERSVADLFVIREGRAFRRTVELGARYGENQEIISGLKKGDVVALTGLQILKDGVAVRVHNPEREKKKSNSKTDNSTTGKTAKDKPVLRSKAEKRTAKPARHGKRKGKRKRAVRRRKR